MTTSDALIDNPGAPPPPVNGLALPEERRPIWPRVALWGLLFAALTTGFAFVGAKPITWDELLYMGIAYQPRPETWILNRYFHIYVLAVFMRIWSDPYIATLIWWGALMAGTVVALAAPLRQLDAPLRLCAGLLTAFLLLTQLTISWSAGIAYADQMVMLLFTVSLAIALGPVLSGRELAWWTCLLLGVLLVFGVKSKETAAAMAWLAVLPFIGLDSRLRLTRRALGLSALYGVGVGLGVLVIVLCDAAFLHDPLFSLRAEHWRALFAFNTGTPGASPWTWWSWMTQTHQLPSFALYVGAVLLAGAQERNLRLTAVFLLPLMFLLELSVTSLSGPRVSARYTTPFLPALCLIAGLATAQLLQRAGAPQRRNTRLYLASGFILLAILAVLFYPVAQPVLQTDPLVHDRSVVPLAMFAALCLAALALGGLRRLQYGALLVLLAGLFFISLRTGHEVVRSAVEGPVRARADVRFRDLRALLQQVQVQPDQRFLVSGRIYDGQIADRGHWAYHTLVQLAARVRVPADHIEVEMDLTQLPPDRLVRHDLILAEPAVMTELTSALRFADGDHYRRVDGPDGEVSLLVRARLPLAREPQAK